MKIFKKGSCISLAVLLVLSVFPVNAWAEEELTTEIDSEGIVIDYSDEYEEYPEPDEYPEPEEFIESEEMLPGDESIEFEIEDDSVQTFGLSGFSPRLSAPRVGDPYYYDYNSYYLSGYGMPNCTAYAYGRAYEILGSRPNLSLGNANQWWGYNLNQGSYSYGMTPKLGAVICWNGSQDGHVAVVEQIEGSRVTYSESAWSGAFFTVREYTIGNEDNASVGGFQGYIYLDDFGADLEEVENDYVEDVIEETNDDVDDVEDVIEETNDDVDDVEDVTETSNDDVDDVEDVEDVIEETNDDVDDVEDVTETKKEEKVIAEIVRKEAKDVDETTVSSSDEQTAEAATLNQLTLIQDNNSIDVLANTDGSGYSYDASNNTLTLTGFTGEQLVVESVGGAFSLVLNGENILETDSGYAVDVDGDLNLSGSGGLMAAGSATEKAGGGGIKATGDITVDDGNYNLNGQAGQDGLDTYSAIGLYSGDQLTIKDGVFKINVRDEADKKVYGTWSSGNTIIHDGWLDIQTYSDSSLSIGMGTIADMIFYGGHINILAETNTGWARGIDASYLDNQITIENGDFNVVARGGENPLALRVYGDNIVLNPCYGDVDITSSELHLNCTIETMSVDAAGSDRQTTSEDVTNDEMTNEEATCDQVANEETINEEATCDQVADEETICDQVANEETTSGRITSDHTTYSPMQSSSENPKTGAETFPMDGLLAGLSILALVGLVIIMKEKEFQK